MTIHFWIQYKSFLILIVHVNEIFQENTFLCACNTPQPKIYNIKLIIAIFIRSDWKRVDGFYIFFPWYTFYKMEDFTLRELYLNAIIENI